MDGSKDSPMPPANAPFNPNSAPLAPSQEAAYRKKCIQLKKRLIEVEVSNDATKRRIEVQKQHVQKMRLMRAILLDHLKQIAETPGKTLSPEELEELKISADSAHLSEIVGVETEPRPDGEALLDDSSDESEDDPEPAERPERRRRPNKNFRESIMTTTPGPNPSMYQQTTGLPNLAPAGGAFSNNIPPEPASLTSSFRVQSTPQQTFANQSVEHSSPVPAAASQSNSFSRNDPPAGSPAPRTLGPQPVRPEAPYQQFTDHMRPQLEDDAYPPDQIDSRIQQEWRDLSQENRGLWEKRYADQMKEYTDAMDEWKRNQKKFNNSVSGVSFSESRNRS